MKRNIRTKIVSMVALFALLLILVASPVSAASPISLTATGENPREDRVTITMPAGTTLGSLESIAWEGYLVEGYAIHVDIIIAAPGGSDALVVEYAYNNPDAINHNQGDAYGSVTGTWITTFGDPLVVTVASNAWLSSGSAGGTPIADGVVYSAIVPGTDFVYGTLANWVAGNEVSDIDANTIVTALEFEVDSWIVDTTALIRNIVINAGGSTVGMGVTIIDPSDPEEDIIAITVSPAGVNFGNVTPGIPSAPETLTVTNTGTVGALVTYSHDETGAFAYLVHTPDDLTLVLDASDTIALYLDIPDYYSSRGEETGVITFWAEEAP